MSTKTRSSDVPAGTSSPSAAPRGVLRLSRESAPSKESGVQDPCKTASHLKSPQPALGSHLKLLRALSSAASGQVLYRPIHALRSDCEYCAPFTRHKQPRQG